jgi:hypothetical protein
VLLIRLIITNRSYTSVFIEEGGWTRYKQTPRANPVNFVNKHSKKLETLICSARARTVRPTGADRLVVSFWCPTRATIFTPVDLKLVFFLVSRSV